MQRVGLGTKLRTKGRGDIWHFGVYVGPQPEGADYCIVHNSKIDGFVVLDTVVGFARGKPMYIAGRAAPGWEDFVAQKALAFVGKKYDLFNFNCEHFANLVVDGKEESPQLQQAIWKVAGMTVVGYALHSISRPSPRRRSSRHRYNVVRDRRQTGRNRDPRTGRFKRG